MKIRVHLKLTSNEEVPNSTEVAASPMLCSPVKIQINCVSL